jgi:type VI secretion system secreted protein VgrG
MATFTQANRPLALTTPLGKDVLLLTAFIGREELSRLFHFQLEMLSEKDSLAPKDLVGKSVTWTYQPAGAAPRPFNGFVSRFAAGGRREGGLRQYRAEVVPWLWFLTCTADCRIFQKKTAPKIIEQIFKDLGFTAYENALKATYAEREYCVQYRETDFHFVSRLMEQEGIFYFFRHENGKHTLVLADHKSAYQDCPEKEVEYYTGSLVPNHIASWEHQYEFRPGKYVQTDYNFETPTTSLQTQSTTIVPLPDNQKFEVYDYPGRYGRKGDGAELTKVRMEEEEAAYDVVRGASTCRTFTPGGKFTLKKHDCPGEAGKGYVLTAVEHSAGDGSYTAGQAASQPYSNRFTCIPDGVTFRPARTTPRPVVQGPQTAVVVGPKGEEIYTDKYGRVKVQFHWDREGKKDENSSCWIRVSENWAGKNWGIVFNPRIGQEVIVEFLEGDPDRPIITGRVYNADQMPPYELPKHQTQSVLKTRSSKGGSPENFNELRFEDKKDSEEIYFHAEKDFNRVVENNDTLKVGSDKAKDGSQTIEIYHHRTETLKTGDEKVTIEKGSRTHSIKKDDTLTVEGKQKIEITGDQTITIKTGNRSVTIQTGNDSLKVSAGSSTTEAAKSIELKVGASSIKIEPAAITLKAPQIKIEGVGMLEAKAPMVKIEGSGMLQAKAPMTQVNGDGLLMLKGGVTMVN